MAYSNDLIYEMQQPALSLVDVVDSFWTLANPSPEDRAVVILPDGRFDLFFSQSTREPFHITFAGLGTEPSYNSLAAGTIIVAVSLKPLALEYVLNSPAAASLNQVSLRMHDDWGLTADDLTDFESCCQRLTLAITNRLTGPVDPRKRRLFERIDSSQGAVPIQQLADEAGWSRRQINRYFTYWFGLSPKAYTNILRYRASFDQIAMGRLFPEGHFADQAHFIRDVKKYSGVTPKELARNQNDRFIQLSLLTKP